jgi:hypothetical protein
MGPTPTPVEKPDFHDKVDPSGTLTRQQRRLKERIEKEAEEVHSKMCANFLDFVIKSPDLTEEVINEKKKQFNAQWKMFCGSRKLTKESFEAIEKAMNMILEKYQSLK